MVVYLLDMGWTAHHLVHWLCVAKSFMQVARITDITINT
jgi:hypothetical protein